MTSFLVSKILIFGVPIVFIGALQYLRMKKDFSLNTIESIYSLFIGFSVSQIFGIKFQYPAETVDFIPWFAIIFSGISLINHKKIKFFCMTILFTYTGWIIFGPLLSGSQLVYLEWIAFVIISILSTSYSYKLKESIYYEIITSVLVLLIGLYVFLEGSISIGQFVIAVGLIFMSKYIFEKVLKIESSQFPLLLPCLMIGSFEFFHYGF